MARFRPFALVAPGFAAVSEQAPVRRSAPERSGRAPVAPFAAVEVDVHDAGDGTVLAGLATGDDEHVLATYDTARRRLGVEVRRAGRTRLVRRTRVDLPASFRLAFVLCENQVTVLTDTGEGWRPRLTEHTRVARWVDLREPATLTRHTYTWGARGGTAPARLAARAGLFGMAGLRDLHLVQHSDGTPYVRDGRCYLTATCAGLGFFAQAHWGVFSFDPAAAPGLEHDLRQEAVLFTRRDGLLLGDHAGQLVRDDEHDRWLVLTSAWGDFGTRRPHDVHVRYTVTSADLVHGGHVLETERLPLPTTGGAWDPGLTRIDGAWHLSFVASPSQDPFDFHPALAAAAPGADWRDGLRLVGEAADLHQCEGPLLVRVGGGWWLLASDGDERDYPVFDLAMRRVGRLDAPYPSNIPHPQLVPLPDGGFLLLTFDGTPPFPGRLLGYGGHGDVVVMRSR